MTRKTRFIKGFFIAFISIVYIVFLTVQSHAAVTDTKPYNIVLSWTDNTSITQAVSWMTTDVDSTSSYVKYIEENDYTNEFLDTKTEKNSVKESEKLITSTAEVIIIDDQHNKYECILKDLKPNTSYIYVVGNEKGGWSQPSSFLTGDDTKKEFKFMYLGDSQFSQDMEKDNAEWGKTINNAYERNPDLAFAISGGDMVNNGSNMKQWDSILSSANGLFSKLPLMTTVGNHECFNYYKQAFTYFKIMALPENGPSDYKEEFYSFDYGNTHITVLNSCVFWDDPLLGDYKRNVDYVAINNWIRRDLSQSSAANKIVILHHPAYKIFDDVTCDKIFAQWTPIFEETGVDVVFSGHQHIYTRTYPMYEGNIDYSKGITYFTAFSGDKTYAAEPVWYMEKEVGYISTYQVITIKNNGIRVICYDKNGKEIDKFYKYEGYLDVSPGNWFSQYVSVVTENDIFKGTNEYSFSPGASMTRAMMATVVSRIDKSDTVGYSNYFADVPDGKWYSESVSWAASNGIAYGSGTDPLTGKSYFSPYENVTREQMAVLFYNYAKYKGVASGEEKNINLNYGDKTKISDWAESAVSWCSENGLMKGKDDGFFDPRGTATRAEVAVMVSNYLDLYK